MDERDVQPADLPADPPADPNRPSLAPATWLVGQLTESALIDPPWAVERAKLGYIQMGELAYHVAEQANGEQTIEEIAAAVSQGVQRTVTTQDVRALIHMVLIPRGVLRDPDDPDEADPPEHLDHATHATLETPAVPLPAPIGRPGRALPVAGRFGATAPKRPPHDLVIGPKALEVVSSVLMWLFWPPVMLVVAGIGLAALFWVYAVHGLAGSIIAVLSRPVLLPFALLLVVLVAGLAPLGPMIALYSGGATIQRLCLRLSLPRPRLLADVDDDYGLSRWARLIVNVGGVYLQLVLTLMLCALGLAAGIEFLFLTVTLLTLHMLWLLLPFGRAQADRLLADVLLVQEPLRYAGQMAETYLPGLAAPDLPPLKRWGYVTLGLYLAVIALALAVVGLTVLWVTPTLLATVWAAFQAFLAGLSAAIDDRDPLAFLISLTNLGLLVLMAFVLTVILVVGGWRAMVNVWAWASLSPRRRLIVAGGMAATLLLMALFWVPINPMSASEDDPPRSLAGATWASLTPSSQGTLADLLRRSSDSRPTVSEPAAGS